MSFHGVLISMTIVHVRCHLLSAPDAIFQTHRTTANFPPIIYLIMLFVIFNKKNKK